MSKRSLSWQETVKYKLQFMFARLTLALFRCLSFDRRRTFGAWVFDRVIAPAGGYRKRIEENLKYARPELSTQEINRHVHEVPQNFGRTFAELFSPDDLADLARRTLLSGPGLVAVQEAQAQNRPSIVVSGHFGNYDILRSALHQKGYRIGGIYRPMNNPYFDDDYVNTISQIAQPLFPRGRKGMAQMIGFLKSGGTLAILIDQNLDTGLETTFFGKPAKTAGSVADLALKYNAVVVPCYAIRDGNGFRAEFEAPIEHSTPLQMVQELNNSLEAQVRKNSTQWFWIHRRWRQ